jgi:hypothetical protein
MSYRDVTKSSGAGRSPSPHVWHRRRVVRGPILRQIWTGLYFQGGANWTDEAKQAFVFRDVEAAIEAAYSSDVAGLELAMFLFDDPRYTIRLNLDEVLGKPPRPGLGWPLQERRTRAEPYRQRSNDRRR